VQALREYEVDLVPFMMGLALKRYYIFSLLNKVYGSPLNRLYPMHQLYAGLVDWISSLRKGEEHILKSRIAAKTFNLYCLRYPLYYLYLARNRDKYANVMLTDVRDVIFQRDPFDFEIADEICFFLEDDRQVIKDCPHNSEWLRSGFGDDTLRELGDEVVSCAGVTIGSYAAIMEYLELMVDHLLRLKFHHIDQGVHNYLIYKRKLKKFRLFRNELGPVFTMGKTVDLPAKFDSQGFVLNKDGSVAHVLHQYDRHIVHGKLALDQDRSCVRLTYKPQFRR
jgi:hypothetical protein